MSKQRVAGKHEADYGVLHDTILNDIQAESYECAYLHGQTLIGAREP